MAKPSLLVCTHLFAAGAGFTVAPREEPLETKVKHEGFFEVDTKRVLAAAVESLRTENSLVVYAYKGFAAVSVEKDGFLLLDGRQDLLVPASITYMVPLSGLTVDNIKINEDQQIMTITLPKLVMSDVAFEPEGARVLNAGLITFSQEQVEEFTRQNYASARRAFVSQAQGQAIIEQARANAEKSMTHYLGVVLTAAGRPGMRVVVRYD